MKGNVIVGQSGRTDSGNQLKSGGCLPHGKRSWSKESVWNAARNSGINAGKIH